eukprot:scaffold8258_cov305-Pinguiococcus_pyrenoidosus.AAC.1
MVCIRCALEACSGGSRNGRRERPQVLWGKGAAPAGLVTGGRVDVLPSFSSRPYLMQLLPDPKGVLESLPIERAQLRTDLRRFVSKVRELWNGAQIGPTLGVLYTEKDIDWVAYTRLARTASGNHLVQEGEASEETAAESKTPATTDKEA